MRTDTQNWGNYVINALGEVEAIESNPNTWLNLDDFWQNEKKPHTSEEVQGIES
jgi:hypothetical protein